MMVGKCKGKGRGKDIIDRDHLAGLMQCLVHYGVFGFPIPYKLPFTFIGPYPNTEY
jgi:hypothetical protein